MIQTTSSAGIAQKPVLPAAILEGNKLIAKFMGGKIFTDVPDGHQRVKNIEPNKKTSRYIWHLEYHTSFDWIKPAIDAFINIDISIFNYNAVAMSEFRQVRKSLSNMPISKRIDDFWNELVTAIVWYNKTVATGSS